MALGGNGTSALIPPYDWKSDHSFRALRSRQNNHRGRGAADS